jgi:metallophosphoesterase superfamily enzyme
VVRDGAGLRLKLPAFVQQKHCWILPAFSPWAAGTEWRGGDETTVWLCSPGRVLRVEREEPQVPSGRTRLKRPRARPSRSCNAGSASP